MPYAHVAAVIVTYAVLGCLVLFVIGALELFPGPDRTPRTPRS
jgi:hypothetical protein